ncbi:MAG: dihydroorotase [Clostridia bacterium]|nr:dihydroorotase [Clostridia bacterium]
MSKMLIKSGRIIDPSNGADGIGDILIEDGQIAEIGEHLNYDVDNIIDAKGFVVAPGLVDMHVHLREPGYTHKEDIISGCEAAAAGGVTTVAAMPNTNPAIDSEEIISFINKTAECAKINVLPVAAITQGLNGNTLTEFEELKKAGAVAFSDDGYPVSTAKLMFDAMQKAAVLDMPVLAHCEDLTLTDGGIMNEGEISTMLGVKGIPEAAENVGTAREIAIAMSTDSSVHICHVSTSQSVDMIRDAKKNNIKITAETCPHYFSLDDSLLLIRDADYRMSPPLRSQEDRRAIIRGIEDGTIDAIATDHAPHTVEEKADFENAPNGSIGLETSLAAGITVLVNGGHITLKNLIELMSTKPSKILGIDCGTLKIGSSADIVIFSEKEKWIVNVEKFHGKSKNSAFKGVELTGKVKYTLCGGKIVYKDEG